MQKRWAIGPNNKDPNSLDTHCISYVCVANTIYNWPTMATASLEACSDTVYSLHYNYLLSYTEHKTTRSNAPCT